MPDKPPLINDISKNNPQPKSTAVKVSVKPSTAKKPASAAKKAPIAKKPDGDVIKVSIGKPAKTPEVTSTEPADIASKIKVGRNQYQESVAKADEIPDDLLPSSDELRLDEEPDQEKVSQWLGEVEKDEEEPDEPEVEAIKEAVESEIRPKAPAAEVEPVAEEPDERELKGFIPTENRPATENGGVTQPEGKKAREVLQSPTIYDTTTVHPPLGGFSNSKRTSPRGAYIVIGLLLIIVLLYLAIDVGLIPGAQYLPVHLLGA